MKHRNLLLTKADIDKMPAEERTHFLNPKAVRHNKSLGDAIGLQNLGVHIITVQPGMDTTEYHIHHQEEECIYVLEGRGTLNIEGDLHSFEAGDFVGFPVSTAAHSLVNDGDEVLVCLVVGQRLAQDVGDYPNKGKRIFRNNGQWELANHADIEAIK